MAIRLEVVSLIIPIQTIEEKYSGGWKAYLDDNVKRIGKVMWYDSNLVRATGCMDSDEVGGLITRFTNLGFTASETVESRTCWADFCITDVFGFSQFDCPWISFDGDGRVAWMRGVERGEVVGREDFLR